MHIQMALLMTLQNGRISSLSHYHLRQYHQHRKKCSQIDGHHDVATSTM